MEIEYNEAVIETENGPTHPLEASPLFETGDANDTKEKPDRKDKLQKVVSGTE